MRRKLHGPSAWRFAVGPPSSEGAGRACRAMGRACVSLHSCEHRKTDARYARPADNRSFPAVTHRRSSRAHQTAAHRQGPWLPVRHRFCVSGRSDHPGPSGFSDPGGSCIEACFASRPGGGITPVSQWRLACLTGRIVSPSLRHHAGCRPGDLEFRTSPKTSLMPGQVQYAPGFGGGRIDCVFPTGVLGQVIEMACEVFSAATFHSAESAQVERDPHLSAP